MNTFIPDEPTLVMLQDRSGVVLATASNIPGLDVKIVRKMAEFTEGAKGKPFNSTAPQVQPVLASWH
jgi:hypothetical protein